MQCDRCAVEIPAGEEMEHQGQTLCEECMMQTLSPSRACDPWAVLSAQTLAKMDTEYAKLSETQEQILQVLEETGGAEMEEIAQRLEMDLPAIERELATLRHMEKIRGKMEAGKKIVILWET
jgi:predicted transcriptional regulator